MKSTDPLPDQIRQTTDRACHAVDSLKALPWIQEDAVIDGWSTACRRIASRLDSGLLKIAVAGAIKSGKSTFINALLGKDLVKRGAGVVTAVTTRIRKGPKNRAVIYLKSWDEINSEIQTALDLFPVDTETDVNVDRFDIRREKDRAFLLRARDRIAGLSALGQDGLRPEALILHHAVNGYEDCRTVVQPEHSTIEFTGRDFSRHQEYSADLSRAFFVKDIQLEIVNAGLDADVEIADCQGADSTDPNQLVHIQTYLESANLIIYVVSSRTGLRHADIHFLSIIRDMGLAHQILFVNNVDLSEHRHLDDLHQLSEKMKADLSFVIDAPYLFSFSTLFSLFETIETRLPAKDKKRLSLWREDKQLVRYSREQAKAFKDAYARKIESDRALLLWSNPLDRLSVLLKAARTRIQQGIRLMSEDVQASGTALNELDRQKTTAHKLETIVLASLDQQIQEFEARIRSILSRFFSSAGDTVVASIAYFIRNYTTDIPDDRFSGISPAEGVYLLFQEFRAALSLFVARQIQPAVIAMGRDVESEMDAFFTSLHDSCRLHLPPAGAGTDDLAASGDGSTIDIPELKRILGLELPALSIRLRYSARVKVGAMTGFGIQSILDLAAMIFQKQSYDSSARAAKKALGMIRQTALKALPPQVDDFQKNLWETYFSPLFEAAGREFRERISNEYHVYDGQAVQLIEKQVQDQDDLEQKTGELNRVLNDINTILSEIARLRRPAQPPAPEKN